MFAGIVSLDSEPITEPLRIALRSALSRRVDEEILEYARENVAFVRASTGALTTYSGLRHGEPDTVSLMAGQPLLSHDSTEVDHERLDQALATGSFEPFRRARGTFCGAWFSNVGRTELCLFGDMLGVRPLYYWQGPGVVVFATALRILEALPIVPLEPDEVGISELLGFGFHLATRTRYLDIRVLREAEVLRFSAEGLVQTTYWRWDQTKSTDLSREQANHEAFARFSDAIKLRLRGDREVIAFLSGGMDSRAIVSVLDALEVNVTTFNCAPQSSQDQVFARWYAEAIGCASLEVPWDVDSDSGFRTTLANLVRENIDSGSLVGSRPSAAWSGDGGSVSLGCVYLDDQVVSLMRNRETTPAINRYMEINSIFLPLKHMRREARTRLKDVLVDGVKAELRRLECEDPAQCLFLFLMFNDQRRHLNDVYEDLDLHRLEYQLPFFDSSFLQFVFSLPLDHRLNHRFYTDWFDVFPQTVRQVPWQTYPGHVPCKIPAPQDLAYQWESKPSTPIRRILDRMSSGRKSLGILLSRRDLGPMSRTSLLLITLIQLAGLRSHAWVVRAAEEFSSTRSRPSR